MEVTTEKSFHDIRREIKGSVFPNNVFDWGVQVGIEPVPFRFENNSKEYPFQAYEFTCGCIAETSMAEDGSFIEGTITPTYVNTYKVALIDGQYVKMIQLSGGPMRYQTLIGNRWLMDIDEEKVKGAEKFTGGLYQKTITMHVEDGKMPREIHKNGLFKRPEGKLLINCQIQGFVLK